MKLSDRLRQNPNYNAWLTIQEAADELDRMGELLHKWMSHDGHVCPSCGMPDNRMQELEAELQQCLDCCKCVGELEAERDRLREALQSAKSLPLPAPKLDNRIHGYVCGFNDGWYAYQQALKEQT